ncbi:Transcription factor GRAS domain-containing protein [Dioscorea alata]|uniref:Transcription factor GRAS domain-containing protein n=2 Tax=Dioscorea alata TaxID=55571 RepID=A0ACB7V3H4_DIOAL|nr:Transcription factor GRAS domain-containing protein [Dioscorea alata]KAH7667905.1 Transcription factor GRAS domain-containing protein [Dioscorea alata]
MVMDQGFQKLAAMTSGFEYDDFFTNQYSLNGRRLEQPNTLYNHQNFVANSYVHVPVIQNSPPAAVSSTMVAARDSSEDSEIFSDIALTYISRMLMEEDIDEKVNMYQQQAALRATEKPFYDILGQKYPYPPSPDQPPLYSNHYLESPDDSINSHHYANPKHGTGSNSNGVMDHRYPYDSVCYPHMQLRPVSVDSLSSTPSIGSSCGSLDYSTQSNASNVAEVAEEAQVSSGSWVSNLFVDSQPAWHFRKGVEEAKKFLPRDDKLVVDLEANGGSPYPASKKKGSDRLNENEIKAEDEGDHVSSGSRCRKNPDSEDLALQEGRSNKQSAVYSEEALRSDMFDLVLLCHKGMHKKGGVQVLREFLQNETSKNLQSSQSGGGKGRGKKQNKKEVVDLRTLLIHCAQAVAADDCRTANELLKQIRNHSSPFGDGTQRLAQCFADGLQARLAGTGSQIYQSLVAKRTTATDILKAYQLYLAACPFKKITHFLSNQTILNVSEKASRVHIIDFGIYFGFQWPCLIQRLAARPGGPPKLRITGIDVPQPGFRPTERIEETGRRLADYARGFGVPFDYNSISSKWETITVEDLKLDKDEVLIVNCLYRFRNLVDETVVVDSPRNKVLNTIRKANPDVFIHGIVNGSYSAPFFVTRFREALFHFSALFDMLDTNVPREDTQRLLIERDLFGREALNVISCEGSERVERPETYKQWQVRNLRAGFEQVPLNPDIMERAKDRVKSNYHKDFVIDEDCRWLLQGWKGRIIYAVSTWRPKWS